MATVGPITKKKMNEIFGGQEIQFVVWDPDQMFLDMRLVNGTDIKMRLSNIMIQPPNILLKMKKEPPEVVDKIRDDIVEQCPECKSSDRAVRHQVSVFDTEKDLIAGLKHITTSLPCTNVWHMTNSCPTCGSSQHSARRPVPHVSISGEGFDARCKDKWHSSVQPSIVQCPGCKSQTKADRKLIGPVEKQVLCGDLWHCDCDQPVTDLEQHASDCNLRQDVCPTCGLTDSAVREEPDGIAQVPWCEDKWHDRESSIQTHPSKN